MLTTKIALGSITNTAEKNPNWHVQHLCATNPLYANTAEELAITKEAKLKRLTRMYSTAMYKSYNNIVAEPSNI